jgi:dTDP-6-deoxy-L-talose 4-dehydrogenase (NAD+)
MHFLISGSSGFLGRALQKKLVDLEHSVTVIRHSDIINLKSKPELLNTICRDMPDIFIHAAWNVNPVNWVETPSQSEFISASGELLKQLSKRGLRTVVGVGSCLEYRPSRQLLFENSPINEDNTYLRDKHNLRKVFFEISEDNGLKSSWARLFHLYGPGDNSKRLIPSILQGFREKQNISFTNASRPINFLHVEDAVTGLICLATSNYLSNSIFNISGEKLVSPIAMRNLLENGAEEFVDEPNMVASKSSEDFYWGSNLKLKELGWSPDKDFAIELRKLAYAQ